MSIQIPNELKIPALWEEDWSVALDEATEGVDRNIILSQGKAAHLLKNIADKKFSFERLAWLGLWNKGYWVLDAARKALNTTSEYTLEVLARTSFELQMHAAVISEQDPVDRLRAYAAWCIANDIVYQNKFVDPKTLDGIWNADPARTIAEDKEHLEQYEKVFGPLNVELDEKELRRGRLRQQDHEQHRLHRLECWLEHPDLASWKRKLDELLKGKNRQIAFFTILDESGSSVRSRLTSMDTPFMYLAYIKGSMFIHGSTIEHIMDYSPDRIGPRSLADRDGCEKIAGMIQGGCNSLFLLLHLLQRKLW